MRALVGGKVFNADFQKQWLASPEAPEPGETCHAEIRLRHPDADLGPNEIYYHEGEMPGYQSFMGYDPANDVTLVIWTNLTLDARRPSDRQHPDGEDPGRDLRGVAASRGEVRTPRARMESPLVSEA